MPLIQVQFFVARYPQKLHSDLKFKSLIDSYEGSFVKTDDTKLQDTVIIPFDNQEDILVGNINMATGLIENIHTAKVEIVDPSKDFCSLQLKWSIKEKQDFVYFYQNNTKIHVHKRSQCRHVYSF